MTLDNELLVEVQLYTAYLEVVLPLVERLFAVCVQFSIDLVFKELNRVLRISVALGISHTTFS